MRYTRPVWVDPAFDKPDLLVGLAAAEPDHALAILSSPSLHGNDIKAIMPHVHWTAAAVTGTGAALLLRDRDEDDQIYIVKEAARRSPAAAERLIPHMSVRAVLSLWRATNSTRFAASRKLQQAICYSVLDRDWATQSSDPAYLELCEEMWAHGGHNNHWRTDGKVAVRYAMGAVTDAHHDRLIEMFEQWEHPFGTNGRLFEDQTTWLLASTYQHSERVLEWAARTELGTVLAAADPRVDPRAKKLLRAPTEPGLRDAFERFVAEPVQTVTAERPELRQRLADEATKVLSMDPGAGSQAALRRWFEQAETFLSPDQVIVPDIEFRTLHAMRSSRNPAFAIVMLDLLLAGPCRSDIEDYLTGVADNQMVVPQPVAEALAQTRPNIFNATSWPGASQRLYRAGGARPARHVHTDAEAQEIDCWGAAMLATPASDGSYTHVAAAPYLAQKLTTVERLRAFYTCDTRRGTDRAALSLYEHVQNVLADSQTQQQADAFTDVFGDALGDL